MRQTLVVHLGFPAPQRSLYVSLLRDDAIYIPVAYDRRTSTCTALLSSMTPRYNWNWLGRGHRLPISSIQEIDQAHASIICSLPFNFGTRLARTGELFDPRLLDDLVIYTMFDHELGVSLIRSTSRILTSFSRARPMPLVQPSDLLRAVQNWVTFLFQSMVYRDVINHLVSIRSVYQASKPIIVTKVAE